jgi:hypothetical protein
MNGSASGDIPQHAILANHLLDEILQLLAMREDENMREQEGQLKDSRGKHQL